MRCAGPPVARVAGRRRARPIAPSRTGVGATLAVPELQSGPTPPRGWPADEQASKQAEQLATRVGAQLPPGRRHRLRQDDEPTLAPERAAHRELLRDQEHLVESAGGGKRLAGAE